MTCRADEVRPGQVLVRQYWDVREHRSRTLEFAVDLVHPYRDERGRPMVHIKAGDRILRLAPETPMTTKEQEQ